MNAHNSSFDYTGHSDNIFCLACSPGDNTIATVASGSRDTTVRIWSINTLSPFTIEEGLVYREHTDCLLSLAWSPDGRSIASGDTAGVVRVWQAATATTLATYRGHARFVRGIAWSPDSAFIVSGGDYGDSTAQVWEAATGRLVLKFTRQYRVFAVAWEPGNSESANTRRVASCSFDEGMGSVQVWDAFTGEVALSYGGHNGPVFAAAWSPDGRFIASGGQDGTVQVWEAGSGVVACRFTGHTKAVKTLAWSPDGRSIASGGDDLNLQVWEAHTGKSVFVEGGYRQWIRAVAWLRAGNALAVASDHVARIVRIIGG